MPSCILRTGAVYTLLLKDMKHTQISAMFLKSSKKLFTVLVTKLQGFPFVHNFKQWYDYKEYNLCKLISLLVICCMMAH